MATTNATTGLTDAQAIKAAAHVYDDGCPPAVAHRLVRMGRIWAEAYSATNAGYPALLHPDQAWRDVPAGTPEQVRAAVRAADRMAPRPRQERFPAAPKIAEPQFPTQPFAR